MMSRLLAGTTLFFALWPLFFNDRRGIGTPNPQWQQTSIPAYSVLRSPQRDSTTILWPFFNYVDDREKKYREWDAPWPLIVFARGEGKTTTRIWPFYSRAANATQEKRFYLWPIYKSNRVLSAPLDRRRDRICFFLYSDLKEKNTETGAVRRRIEFLPFFTHHRDFNGNSRLQILAPLEPFVPTSKSLARDWSPLWSVWRAEKNPRPVPRANRCCGTYTGAKPRPPLKSARSCSAFSSINPVPKASICVCFIFPWVGRAPGRAARQVPRRQRPTSPEAPGEPYCGARGDSERLI